VLPKSTIVTLALGGIVIVGAIIAYRRGHLENKALMFAVGLLLLLWRRAPWWLPPVVAVVVFAGTVGYTLQRSVGLPM